MSIRDLITSGRSVPVRRGTNPVYTFQDEMNRLFHDFFGSSVPSLWEGGSQYNMLTPSMDVVETDKDICITTEVPGMDTKDVDISVTDQFLTIKGEKKEERSEEEGGYYRRERSYGSFQRSVALPDTADTEKVEASLHKGVLTITISKKAGAVGKSRKVEIKRAA